MRKLRFNTWMILTLLPLTAPQAATRPKEHAAPAVDASWPGEEMPLPLSVRNSDDLLFKEAAERQYLIFNLLASGKLAYDRGDMATAATKWEMLLRVPNLPADLDRVLRPLAIDARQRAGGAAAELPPEPAAPSPDQAALAAVPAAAKKRVSVVRGFVTGGGSLGAGGTVVWLKRRDGATPQPRPSRGKTVSQKGKK